MGFGGFPLMLDREKCRKSKQGGERDGGFQNRAI